MINPNTLALIVSEVSALVRTDGHGLIDSSSDPDLDYIYFIHTFRRI